jgi:NitT/TauT family transport system substrate-binding protein
MLGIILLAQALTLVVAGPPTSPEYLPIRVAEAEGHFAREGVKVTVRTTRAEPGAAEALAQGQADLVATSLESMLRYGLRATGGAPRLVVGLPAAPPVALLVSGAHAETVRTADDLPGTRLGVVSPGVPSHAWLGWLLARAGLSVAQVGVTSLGARGVVGAVESGDVHTGLVPEPFATRLLAGGRARLLADLRSPAGVQAALGAATVNAAVFARADRRPSDAVLGAVARALLAAERRIADAEPDALAARLPRRVVGLDDDFADRLQTARGVYLQDGMVSAAQVEETLALIRASLPLSPAARVPPPETLLDLGPLQRALRPPPAR